jgi:hypothetical protein
MVTSIGLPTPVALGASAPQVIKPGHEFTARFVAYIQDIEDEVERMLLKMSPRSEVHLGVKRCRWRVGTSVKVRLAGEHLTVRAEEGQFTWDGHSSLVDFDVRVSADAPDTVTILKFDVSIDEIVVARIRLDLEINSTKTAVQERRTIKSEPAETAFAS